MKEYKNKKIGVVMSSSFFGFVAHAGFLEAIRQLGISPYGFSGSSAGALIAAYAAADVNSKDIKKILFNLHKKDFWDPDYCHLMISFLKLMRGWKGLLKGALFKKLVEENLPVKYFEECKYKCAIVATNLSKKEKHLFYKGELISAICASGAVPGLFQPVKIAGDYFIDGGLTSKAPILDLYKLIRPEIIIVHYIKSKDLERKEIDLFSRFLPPYKMQAIASTITRHAEYQLEAKIVKRLGCDVIEISPDLPRLSPFDLSNVEDVYNMSLSFTKSQLIRKLKK